MTFVNPADPPERREEKLIRITEALMRRVEQGQNDNASSFEHFQRSVMLEERVRERTRDLEATLSLLNQSNARLATAMEAEQRARSDLFNALETVQEGFALFGGDGRLVMFNSRFCRQLPDVREGLHVGVHIDDYFDLVSESRYLDRAASGESRDWAQWRRLQRREQHAIFNIKLVGGSFFQVSEHRTPDGGAAILQTDVTEMIRLERKERERLLDDQARVVRATLDHIDQGVVIFDGEEQMAGWNRRLGALLMPPMKLVRIGVRFSTLFEAISKAVTFASGGSAADITDWVANRKDRAPLTFEITRNEKVLSGFAQVMPDGGFVISFADVTAERDAAAALHQANEELEQRVDDRTHELAQALEEAERANASKSRFVAAASHDLLQPLSAAKLFVASLEAMNVSDSALSAARKAGNALDSVETILDGLLEISKLDSGRAVMKQELVSLGDLLEQLNDEYAPLAEAKELSLTVRATDAAVVSDPAYLRRILQNLISNAIRYTASGRVLVGARRSGDAMRVEVWDTGPGIPEDRRMEIFEEFNRLDATANAAEGLGLGLSIVDRAARMLGHGLEMRSRVGRGSCFAVAIPLAADTGLSEGALSGGAPAMRDNMLVMVIASDDTLREALSMLLETWGIFVFEASDADSAHETLRETGVLPDAIITDEAVMGQGEPLAAIVSLCGMSPTAVIASDRSTRIDRLCRERSWALIRAPFDATAILEFLAEAGPFTPARRSG